MKSLVLLAAIFVAGCSAGVSHQAEDEHSTEESSDVERSRTTVAVSILDEPTPHHDSEVPDENQSPSSERSTTIVKVIVPEPSPKVIMIPLPPVPRHPNRMIQVAGNGNTVILGDVHLHHHEHVHVHQAPKPAPVRINVRAEDRVSERERTRRMVEARIARFFPRYGK